MSYIVRSGNLASTPELRDGERGKYCYARVIVTDRIRKGDEYVDGPEEGYDVAVSGDQAVRLVAAAEASGNVRVLFAGTYRLESWTDRDGNERVQRRVSADEIGISLRLQDVRVEKRKDKKENDQAPAKVEDVFEG